MTYFNISIKTTISDQVLLSLTSILLIDGMEDGSVQKVTQNTLLKHRLVSRKIS